MSYFDLLPREIVNEIIDFCKIKTVYVIVCYKSYFVDLIGIVDVYSSKEKARRKARQFCELYRDENTWCKVKKVIIKKGNFKKLSLDEIIKECNTQSVCVAENIKNDEYYLYSNYKDSILFTREFTNKKSIFNFKF